MGTSPAYGKRPPVHGSGISAVLSLHCFQNKSRKANHKAVVNEAKGHLDAAQALKMCQWGYSFYPCMLSKPEQALAHSMSQSALSRRCVIQLHLLLATASSVASTLTSFAYIDDATG